jgi:hypothetical protein
MMAPIYFGSHLSSRNQFGQWLTSLDMIGLAAEIGTHRGEFAKTLLKVWKGRLWCVDPWANPTGYEEQAAMLPGLGGDGIDREADLAEARQTLRIYVGRHTLIRSTSQDAVSQVPNNLDFVYIDGDHRKDAVYQDLHSWYPKLRKGGILAGHDWFCPGERDGLWGVNIQPALNGFCVDLGIDRVYLIVEEGGLPWSWYLFKK